MGVTCRIVRDSNGNINYLETNDGQRSNLFDNLRSLYGTEKALDYFALTESENFKDVQEVKRESEKFQIIGETGALSLDTAEEVTFRIDNLLIAKEMETRGKTPLEIRLATGWEKSKVDSKWRYEIQDGQLKDFSYEMNITSDNFERPAALKKLVDVYQDETLFKAFPKLKESKVVIYNTDNYLNEAVMFNYNGDIFINERKAITTNTQGFSTISDYGRGILLHELSHTIQNSEGFGRGDNPKSMEGRIRDALTSHKVKNKTVDGKESNTILSALRNRGVNLESLNELSINYIAKEYAYELYEATSGEVEARNVTERMSKTAEQRLSTLLTTTEDIATEDQVFLENNLSLQMSLNDYKSNIESKLSIFDTQVAEKNYPTILEVAEEVLPKDIFTKYKNLYEMGARNNIQVDISKVNPGFTASWGQGMITLDKTTAKFSLNSYEDFAETLNHETIHGLIARGVKDNYSLSKDLENIMSSVEANYDSASEEVKSIINYIQDTRKEFIESNIQTATDEELESGNFKEIGSLEELITYAFTNTAFAKFLDSIPASKDLNIKGNSIFEQLKNIIRGFVKSIVNPTALDEISTALEKYFNTEWNEKNIKERNDQYNWGIRFEARGMQTPRKEAVKVEKNEVNGKLVYEPFFKGKKMGALRLLPYNSGYRVDSVIVYDKFQKKGVARNLYKYAINDLSKQDISLSSLNIRAPYAEKIWEGLVNEGIATKDGNDYRAFREPKLSDVLEYANETEEPLTREQSVQAIDTLASFGINNSLELFEKLKEAFVKDGAIVFDRKKLEKAGYNSYEITSILTNRDLQQQIKENIYKVKNTDLSIDLEGLEVLKTDEVSIFGRQTVYVKSEREAVNEIIDGEIKSKKTDTLQTLNKTYPKTLPEIDTRPFETILKVTENVAKNNHEKLRKVAQAMQEEALKYGVDLRGIENKIYPIQRLKSFTESLVNYISEPNNNFYEVYDKFFEVSQLPKAENKGNDVKLDTELSEYELFRDHNLVRKEGNTYTKVSPENIEDLYNYFLRQQNGKQSNTEQRDRTRWDSSRGNQTLEGAPIVEGVTGADSELTYWAEEYAKRNNIPYKRQSSYVEVDEARAKRIAEAYDKMEHNPSDPKVKEAFQNLINQTIAQYRILEEAGYKFYLFDETNDPYNGNPYNAMRDLRSNKVMGSFATEAGFGSGATEINVEDNPMLQDTGIRWGYGSVEGEQKKVLANDLFRTVHDAFGHGLEGSGFRARGEENAWQAHARLFTGSALGAITSETRGQNSWLNYGKYAEQNRTAKVEDTIFADQKTGLMPEWAWTEGFDKGREAEFKTKEDIQARTPELEVEDYQTDSDVLEALFIWKNFLGYPVKTKSNKKAPFKGMTNNPFKVITADGIVLKNNDTLTRAKADLYEEEVVKEDIDYQDEVREKISLGEIIPEKIKTDYTIIEDGVLMTKNNTNQFLRTPLANYELIYQDGNLSFYKDILGAEKNLSDIDFTKYLNESVKPDNYIVAKSSYSKQELEEINNKYFSCK